MNSQAVSAIDRVATVFATWVLTYLTSKGIISTSDAAAFLPILIAIPVAVWGLYKNRQSALIAQMGKIAADPESPVKAIITTNTPEGRALADAVPDNSIVAAGTIEATKIARGEA